MKNYILNEAAFTTPVSISAKKTDSVEFIATMQESDAPNRNGRVYPKKVLEQALQSPYVQERLRTNSFIGEANHPLDTSVQRQMSVDLRNAAFIVKEFWWEGNLVKARCETANTSVGRDMKGLIEQGVQVAFSLRAQGNVHTNPVTGLVEVEAPLQICTYDWVLCPSHSKAFMEKICEATSMAMFGVQRNKLESFILTESENAFMTGNMYDPSEAVIVEEIDYTKSYTTQLKKIEDMYIPLDEDVVTSLGTDVTIINSKDDLGNAVVKSVLTEDYLVKDFRNRLLNLCEDALERRIKSLKRKIRTLRIKKVKGELSQDQEINLQKLELELAKMHSKPEKDISINDKK